MLVVLPICATDIDQMSRLVAWMAKLSGCKGHHALIVTHTNIPFDRVIELRTQVLGVFDAVELIGSEGLDTGWPIGSNALFWTAARHCKEHFLWLESDCTPMRPGWLDEIEVYYTTYGYGKLFCGHIYSCTQPFLPSRLMSGIAVYPADAHKRLPLLPDSPRAWDVDGAEVMVADGAHTPLIHHFYGEQNLPPTFVARKDAQSPVNAMTLEDIPSEAALYHRNKDGSLIRLLERKLFPHEFREKITVCFPVYQGDLSLALIHSKWLQRMGRRHEHRAIICHDPSCPVVGLNQFEQMLRGVFTEVESFVYQRPPIPTYPAAANWAFQNVAMHMARGKSPWLFFEADTVALKPDWIEQLQAEYDSCGRSWMGPHVQGMNHANGVMVFPADAALRMPNAMRCGDGHAFDMAAAADIMQDCHDCNHLLFHTWSIFNGQWHPVGGGVVPSNVTLDLARQIPRSACAIHRVKDSSLIDLLLRGEFKP